MTVNGKSEGITCADLEIVASRNDIQDYEALVNTVSRAIGNFERYANELDMDKQLIKDICSEFVLF